MATMSRMASASNGQAMLPSARQATGDRCGARRQGLLFVSEAALPGRPRSLTEVDYVRADGLPFGDVSADLQRAM